MAAAVLLLLSLALRGAAAGGAVPLVAWSTASGLWSGPSSPPLPAAGHLLEDHQLGALLEPALTRGPRTVLLVLHDELSVEDFTAYGGVHGDGGDSAFPRLQAALAAAGSVLQLAAVPGGAVGLPHTLGAEPLLDDGAVGRLRAANGSGGALLLRLPRIAHGSRLMSPREVLASNDEALGEVLSALQAEGLPYTAVLTALRPSREEARLVLRYGDVSGGPLSITLVLKQRWFPVSARRWFWLAEIDISGGGKGGTSSSLSNRSRFYGIGGGAGAPIGWSWRCEEVGGPGDFLSSSDPPGPWRINFKGLQVQPFNVSGFRFGGAADCSAFVSGGAAMGLLVAALLTAVAAHGGALLLRLRPMDRFDDPRGPPLHVAPGE